MKGKRALEPNRPVRNQKNLNPKLRLFASKVCIAASNTKVLEHFNDFADAWVLDLVEGAPHVNPKDGCFGHIVRPPESL